MYMYTIAILILMLIILRLPLVTNRQDVLYVYTIRGKGICVYISFTLLSSQINIYQGRRKKLNILHITYHLFIHRMWIITVGG